jgi:FkbM family methyltransferase
MIDEPGKPRGRFVRVLHRYWIDGVSLLAYDEVHSNGADWVASELLADEYGLRQIHFDEGDVVIDIGAHIGLFSSYLARRWPGVTVFAFEPFPVNFRNCAENLRLNGVTNVVLSNRAVAGDNRRLNMATDPSNSGAASALVKTFQSHGKVSDVASVTLDEVFAVHGIERCRLLKIDCEGMEYEILPGAGVLDKVEYLAGEFHSSAYLQSLGWCPERLGAWCRAHFADSKMTIKYNEIPE